MAASLRTAPLVLTLLCCAALVRLLADAVAAMDAEDSAASAERVSPGQPCVLRSGRFELAPQPYADRAPDERGRGLVLLATSAADAADAAQALVRALSAGSASADIALLLSTAPARDAPDACADVERRLPTAPSAAVRVRCVRADELGAPDAAMAAAPPAVSLWARYLRRHARGTAGLPPPADAVLALDGGSLVQGDPFGTPSFGGVLLPAESTSAYLGDCPALQAACAACLRALAARGGGGGGGETREAAAAAAAAADCAALAELPLVSARAMYGAAGAVLGLLERVANATAARCAPSLAALAAAWATAGSAPHPVLLSTAEFGPLGALGLAPWARAEAGRPAAHGGEGSAARLVSLAADAPQPYAVAHGWEGHPAARRVRQQHSAAPPDAVAAAAGGGGGGAASALRAGAAEQRSAVWDDRVLSACLGSPGRGGRGEPARARVEAERCARRRFAPPHPAAGCARGSATAAGVDDASASGADSDVVAGAGGALRTRRRSAHGAGGTDAPPRPVDPEMAAVCARGKGTRLLIARTAG